MNQLLHLHRNKTDRDLNLILNLIPLVLFAVILALLFTKLKGNPQISERQVKTEAILGQYDSVDNLPKKNQNGSPWP